MQHRDTFDYWGQGTEVTVSSEPAASPAVFPLVQCTSGSEDKITLGCLAQNFFPKKIDFLWTDANETSSPAVQYPPAVKDNRYTSVSLIQVSKSDWDSKKSFKCSVTHVGATINLQLQSSIDLNIHEGRSEPKVTVHKLQDEDTEQGAVTLVCLVFSSENRDYSITWSEQIHRSFRTYQDGINFPALKTENGYLATSVYNTTKEKWDKNTVFYCNAQPVGSNTSNRSRGVSKSQGQPGSNQCDAVDCTTDTNEEDEISSLWFTTSSFICLFMSSVFYSVILSLVKIRK